MVEGFDYPDEPEDVWRPPVANYPPDGSNLADSKAVKARDAETLTAVERFVTQATETNFMLFEKALEHAVEEVRRCYDDWIPAGEAQWLMQRMDNAKNFLASSEMYFMALSTPLIQAANLHIQHQMRVEANVQYEPSAAQRTIREGARVHSTDLCMNPGGSGTVMEVSLEYNQVLVKFDDGTPGWHSLTCLELEG